MKKPTIKELKKKEFLKISELAELNEVRYSTIKYYSQLGLLPYIQHGKGLDYHYPTKEASKRLQEILKLRAKRQTIPDIIKRFKQAKLKQRHLTGVR